MKVSNEIFFAAVEERIEAGERVKITLVGTSMRPTLLEGDVLTIEASHGLDEEERALGRYRLAKASRAMWQNAA